MTCTAHELARTRRHLLEEDVNLIRDLVWALPADTAVHIVDLGAGSGTTAISVFAERTRLIHVTTYDISRENLDWATAMVASIHAGAVWSGIERDSVDAAAAHADERLDLILLDTSHELEHTRREIAAWWPKLRSGGLWWFHDYVDGVQTAVDEAVAAGLLVPVVRAGLGWSGRKP